MSSYAILGTGAVGGYYGGLLQRAGMDVHFLLRSDYEYARHHGLRIDSINGDFQLDKINAHADAATMPRCDVAVVAWKTTENGNLAAILPKVVKPGGVVLVLQNGLDPEREAAAASLPDAKILGGLCFLCARKQGPGWIRHLDYGAVTLAAYDRGTRETHEVREADGEDAGRPLGVTPEMRAVAEDFRAAGIETRLHEDWRAARWRKLVWNVPFNGLCALLGADTSALLRHPPMRAMVRGMMSEVAAGAALSGAPLPEDFVNRMMADTDAMSPYEPSMKLDRDAGRAMELDAIYGRTLEVIVKAGGAAPLMEALLAQLGFAEGLKKGLGVRG